LIDYFRYSTLSDVWAVGITMYEVIKLKKAFYGKEKEEIKNILMSGQYPRLEIDSEKDYDEEMIDVVNTMLNVYIIILFIMFYFL
jgi:serine/threonine protein kinase